MSVQKTIVASDAPNEMIYLGRVDGTGTKLTPASGTPYSTITLDLPGLAAAAGGPAAAGWQVMNYKDPVTCAWMKFVYFGLPPVSSSGPG
ncbi:hypothetical protein SBV1_900019 [Verrucomicrobia bacterium]|nr:hypothetical protein SBV1_900019 [Verrucomicrobiota bacterium]